MSAALDAVLAYLRQPGFTVYDGPPGSHVEDPQPAPPPYFAVYSNDGRPTATRLQTTANRSDETISVLTVGIDTNQIRLLREHLKALAYRRINGQLVQPGPTSNAHPDDEVPGSLLSAYDLFTIPAGVTNA